MPEPSETSQTASAGYHKVSLKEFFKISKWTLAFWFKLDPLRAGTITVTTILTDLQNLGYSFILAKLIDTSVKVATLPNAHITQLYPFIATLLIYNVATGLLKMIDGNVETALNLLNRTRLRKAFYGRLYELGIQELENPQVSDSIHRGEEYLLNLRQFFVQIVDLISRIIRLVTTFAISVTMFPALIPVVIIVSIPYLLFDKRYRNRIYKFDFKNTEGDRRATAASGELMTPKALEEISISGAYTLLDKIYSGFRDWANSTRIRMFSNWNKVGFVFELIRALIIVFAYIQLFARLLAKKITIGNLTFFINTLSTFQNSVTMVVASLNNISESALRLKDVYNVFNLKPLVTDGTTEIETMSTGPEVHLSNITFTYQQAEKPVIEHLNLKISAGEKVAIVGPNGAGKTTLVKLICRFYQPQQGAIYINGEELKNLKIESFYKNIGVLAQDYNRYPYLTAKENIYIGKPDEPIDEVAIRLAAQAADAIEFIEEYPNKFDQVLSERYKGGIRPSTGQWQKIAIARFFYRNAPLVIFDEPTASIDAVSEFNIFNRIYDFFKGKTVIIISHRFSTVRNADRIIVLDKGKIVEEGTHDQLMQLDGQYAKAFLLQAQGYTTTIV